MHIYSITKKSIFIFASLTLFIGGNFSLALANNQNVDEILTTTFNHSSGPIDYVIQDKTLNELATSCVNGDQEKCATLESKKSELLVLMDEQYSASVEAWKQKNYSEALKLFLALSEKGHPNAQRMIGIIYQRGLETEQNAEEALKWFKLSADQNFSPSQYKVGEMYYRNFGNDSEAAKWYQLSANQGYRSAKVQLGFMYFRGEGVEQNYQKARDLVEPSLEKNDWVAQYVMGELFYDGQVVEKNQDRAIELFKMSAKQNFPPAKLALCNHLYLVEKQIETSLEWCMPAAETYAEAATRLGTIYAFELINDPPQSYPATGVSWLTSAANAGFAEACYRLGIIYQKGSEYIQGTRTLDNNEIVKKDVGLAIEWFSRAALECKGDNAASGQAAIELAWIYDYGEGAPKDEQEAKKWYTAAAELGHSEGVRYLANLEEDKQRETEALEAENKRKINRKIDELLTVEIAGRNRSLEDSSLRHLAAKCAEGDQNACDNLETQKPDAIAELSEKLKNRVDCKVKHMIGTTYGDFYQSYINDDWSRKKDREYNFLINLEWTVTYKGSEKIGGQGKYGEDFVGVMNKDAIVPFKKMGNKFIPVFSNHMSVIDIADHPEILEAFLLAEVGSAEHLLFGKSKCTIEKISKK